MQVNLFVFTFFVTISKITVAKRTIADFAIPQNCTEVYSISVPKYVPYQEQYRQRKWFGYKWQTRTNYRLENHMSHQLRSVCCAGYTSWGSSLCVPVCSHSCMPNAICAQPETCRCDEGYQIDFSTSVGECKPICVDECINGDCVGPNTCSCHEGYRMLPDLTTCTPICDPGCDNLEYCVEPHVCRCINAYKRQEHSIDRVDTSDYSDKPCQAICDQECVNADCVEPNLCRCHKGFKAMEDDSFTCQPICENSCHNGVCIGPNDCQCSDGYKKSNVSHICLPICSEECINAECIAPDMCSCFDGYAPVGGEASHICQPYCSSTCEHGKCTAPEVCTCGDGYESVDNATRCSPVCSQECVMGNCTSPEVCTCHEGYKLSEENVYKCEPICREGCINGFCTAPDECTCHDGYEKEYNNSTDAEENVFRCTIICGCDNGFCNKESPACERCQEGYDLDPDAKLCRPHCNGDCPNGRCVEPQVCECDENYIAENDTLGNPICVRACGGECYHGTCEQESNTCSCLNGWTGQFCDEATLCTIVVSGIENNNTLQMYLNESQSANNETKEVTDAIGSVPSCNDRCLQQVNNMTKCITQFDEDLTIVNITCFISINSPCNALAVVDSKQTRFDHFGPSVGTVTLLTSFSLLILLIIGIALFVRKRKSEKSNVTLKSIQQIRKNEEHQLIESDSISL